MARIFWMSFAYGFCSGLMFWVHEKMVEGWRRAYVVQPVAV
jgi:hypothetical protein